MNGNNYKNSHFGFGFRFRPKRKMGVSASFGFGRNEKKPFGRALKKDMEDLFTKSRFEYIVYY